MEYKINQVYIVHGYQATSNDHWYPWLSRQLKKIGINAKRIMLANSIEPNMDEWQSSLKVQIPQMDEQTLLVAHGLSCLSVLKFVEQHYEKNQRKIGGIIMVAGFHAPLVAWSELNSIMRTTTLDFKQLQYAMKRSFMYISSNDPYVPAPVSLRLAHSLNSNIFEMKQVGHFCKADGFVDFPQLLDVIEQLSQVDSKQSVEVL